MTTHPPTHVIGYYSSQFGELWHKSLSDLIQEAVDGALHNAKITIDQVEAIFVGNMLGGILENNAHLSAKVSEVIGRQIPIFRLESACASAGTAFHLAKSYLESGSANTALVLGVEKMTDYSSDAVTSALMSAASGEEQQAGLTFPGLYALMARAYLEQYGYTEEHLAHISVKNHYHGSLNEKAHFQNRITVDQVLQSPPVASPLKLLDCSPITDGSSAVVITNQPDLLAKSTHKAKILASQVASDSISLKNRASLLELKASRLAADKAFAQAQIARSQVDVIELHDCFSIAEILAMEDLGFWEKGQGGRRAGEYCTQIGSNTCPVVNTSGGLKAAGHPVGATGTKQLGEIYLQLTGQATNRQVPNATYGLVHNVGGSGGSAVVTILEKIID
jgi:acetyl-CoA C-acetyltransferase